MNKLTIFLSALLALPILLIFSWYLLSFLPHTSQLESTMASGQKSTAGISDLRNLAVIAESKSGIRHYAILQAYYYRSSKQDHQKTYLWRLNTALWYFSSKLHYNDDEMFFLWATYAPYLHGVGLENAAKYYYNKALKDLTLREKAEIVAAVKGPSLYRQGSSRLKERVDTILDSLSLDKTLAPISR